MNARKRRVGRGICAILPASNVTACWVVNVTSCAIRDLTASTVSTPSFPNIATPAVNPSESTKVHKHAKNIYLVPYAS